MKAKEFLLKKFPTNKYWDCPVPKHHWEIMEEYAKAYHEEQVKLLRIGVVSNQRKLLIAWNNWMKNEYPDYIPIPIYIIDKFLSNQ